MRTFSCLIKPSSSNCNLNCKYCFYHDVANNRKTYSHGFMQTFTTENIIKKVLDITESNAIFVFQGGEPTLIGLDYYKNFVYKVNDYNKNKIKISYSIQTNGTLLNEEWCKFLYDNKFLVGVSLDGTKELHDNMRGNLKDGEFNKIVKNIRLLEKYNVEYNILTVVTKYIAKHYEKVYNNLKKLGFKYLQFIPCLDDFSNVHKDYSLSAKSYGEFLLGSYKLWYNDYKKGNYISVRLFDNIINKLNGKGNGLCSFNGFCSCQYVIEADGTAYPCDFYCIDKYELGNINDKSFEQLFNSDNNKIFLKEGLEIHSDCKICEHYNLCRGGCRREYNDSGKNVFCESYNALFNEILK